MGLSAFAAPFAHLQPVEVDPFKYAAQYQQLQALSQQRQLRQQQMATEQQTQQLNELRLKETQYGIDERTAINKAYANSLEQDPDTGQWNINPSKFEQSVTQAGHGSSLPAFWKTHNELETTRKNLIEANLKVNAAQVDHGGALGQSWLDNNSDPQYALTTAKHDYQNKLIGEDTYRPFVNTLARLLQEDPTGGTARAFVTQSANNLITHSATQQGLRARQTEQQEKEQGLATAQRKAAIGEVLPLIDPNSGAISNQDAYNAVLQKYPKSGLPTTPDADFGMGLIRTEKVPGQDWAKFQTTQNLAKKTPEQWAADVASIPSTANIAGKQYDISAIQKMTGDAVNQALARKDFEGAQKALDAGRQQAMMLNRSALTQAVTAPVKIEVARDTAAARQAADLGPMTPQDFKDAGEVYARTGVMPPAARNKAMQTRILHEAYQFARDNGMNPAQLPTLAASYKADQASLTKLQTSADAITAFENTAKANLDVFLDRMKKVIDSGSPLINKPLRELASDVFGSENVPAMEAGRRVMVNEFAKISSNPNLTGTLSDSARHEVENFIPASATLKQAYSVAQVLVQDAANRHKYLNQQISEVKGRIGGGANLGTGAQGGGEAPKSKRRYNPATGRIEVVSAP